MEGRAFPPELLQREVRERLNAPKGTLIQQNFPTSRQLADDIRGLFAGRLTLEQAVARANKNRRQLELMRGVKPTPPSGSPPEPEPAQNLAVIRNRQAMATGKTYYYRADRGQPNITPRMPFAFTYVDKGGIIGAEDRFPSGVPRTWRLLETYSGKRGSGSVLSLESEMRPDGTFPVPPKKGTHEGRATMSMKVLQDLVDGGQIGVKRLENPLSRVTPLRTPVPQPEPEPERQRLRARRTKDDVKNLLLVAKGYELYDTSDEDYEPAGGFDDSDL